MLIMFPQAHCIIVTQTDDSSSSTLVDDRTVYASESNQSGRNPEPEAEVWWGLTGISVQKAVMRNVECIDNPERAWCLDAMLFMLQLVWLISSLHAKFLPTLGRDKQQHLLACIKYHCCIFLTRH